MGVADTVGAPPKSSWISLLALRSPLSASVLVCLQSLHLCLFFGGLPLALRTLADSRKYLGVYIPGAALRWWLISMGVCKLNSLAWGWDKLGGVIHTWELPSGITWKLPSLEVCLKSHPCLASSPSLSRFPHSLTGFSWAHFLNKLLAHKFLSPSVFLGNAT